MEAGESPNLACDVETKTSEQKQAACHPEFQWGSILGLKTTMAVLDGLKAFASFSQVSDEFFEDQHFRCFHWSLRIFETLQLVHQTV